MLHGLRTADLVYLEYGNGERELYDLQADPSQLDNLIGEADPALVAALAQRLTALATRAQPDAKLQVSAETAGARLQ